MKKLTVIFAFILIAVFSVGSFFIHQVYLNKYKQEFRSYLFSNKKETVFTNITIHKGQLYKNSSSIMWEDDNQEIVYQGVLYDIINIRQSGVNIALSVVSDNQEMELKNQFAAFFNCSSNNNKTKAPLELLKNFFAFKYIVDNSLIGFKNSPPKSSSPNTELLFQITEMVIQQETPPPDFCI